MGNMRSLLLAGDPGNEFKSGLMDIISLIFTALGILMVLYAVYLFFLMATASDESKRRSAKSRVVKTFASVLIVVALIGMLQGLKITITTPKVNNPSGGGTVTADPFLGGTVQPAAVLNISFEKYDATGDEYFYQNPDVMDNTTKTNMRYLGIRITIKPGEVTLNANAQKTYTVTKVTGFRVTMSGSNAAIWGEKYWRINPSGNNLTVEYEARSRDGVFIQRPRCPVYKNADGTLSISIAVDVEITDKSGGKQTGVITGLLKVAKTSDDVKFSEINA